MADGGGTNPGATRRARVPWGLVGALALTLAGEAAVARVSARWGHAIVLDWADTARAASRGREVAGAKVLAFGSSMVKFGVLPGVVEARTGLPGYNLALLNGPPPASYFLLRRALARGARPSAVVVDFDQHRMEADPRSDRFRYPWAELLSPREALDLAWEAGDAPLLAEVLVPALIPSARRRFELRAAVRVRLEGYTAPIESLPSGFGTKPAFARNRRVNRGAVVNASRGGPGGEAPAVERRTGTGRPDPLNVRYLNRFLDLCRAHGAAVVWLVPPVAPAQQGVTDASAAESRFLAWARWRASRAPGVTVADARRAGYPAPLFVDHCHLDREGAAALSEALAPLLARLAGPGRAADAGPWVSLPAFRPSALAAGVEDLARSDRVWNERAVAAGPAPGGVRR